MFCHKSMIEVSQGKEIIVEGSVRFHVRGPIFGNSLPLSKLTKVNKQRIDSACEEALKLNEMESPDLSVRFIKTTSVS